MRRISTLVALGLFALMVCPALAQQGQFAALQGRVVDESGAGIPASPSWSRTRAAGCSGRSSATLTAPTT